MERNLQTVQKRSATMLQRLVSLVFVVLFSWTMIASVEAAKRKMAVKTTSKIVYVCNAKKAATIKKPQRAVIIDCSKRKVAHVPKKKKTRVAQVASKLKVKVATAHELPTPTPKNVMGRVVRKQAKQKAPDPVQVNCLAKLGLGEAGDEPPLAQKVVLYVTKNYSQRVTFRSVCKETRDEGRYSYLLFGENMKTIRRTVRANGKDWTDVKARAFEVLRDYPEPPLKELEHATTWYKKADSTPNGTGWILENTYPIGFCDVNKDFQLGDHVFRIEKVYAWKILGIVCPKQKPNLNLIAQKANKKIASSK